MHIKSLAFILLSSWLVLSITAQPSRSYRLAYYNTPAKIKGREQLDDYTSPAISEDDDYEDDYTIASSRKTNNAATGRLFFNKLFGNNNNRQPVIPIIITGAGQNNPGTGLTTASIPAATGTITTSPIAGRGQMDAEEEETEDASENVTMKDEDFQKQQAALQNAIAVAAQEYVAANGPMKGTEDDISGQLNVREKDDKNKFITVRIPVKYRKLFKNGQKVYLSHSANNNNRRRRNRNRNRRVRN